MKQAEPGKAGPSGRLKHPRAAEGTGSYREEETTENKKKDSREEQETH